MINNIKKNHLKINIFTAVKYCCILHGRVCVMFYILVPESNSVDCNFENGDTCLWRNDKSDQSEWTLQTQGTDTSGTGPDNDHTVGTATGKFKFHRDYKLLN